MPAEYYFDELDPVGFQRLVGALLVHRYGEGIRLTPLRGADGGRDAETPVGSSGTLVVTESGTTGASRPKAGRYFFQVKHHRMADRPPSSARSAVLGDFSQELENNVLTRPDTDRVDYFFLVTNVPGTRDAFQKQDEKRLEALKKQAHVHAEILWQEHLKAWLDQAPSLWSTFPEIFAGRIVPLVGQMANDNSDGLARSVRVAIRHQFERDATIRFRQVSLEQRLTRLFVDLDAQPSYYPPHILTLNADISATFDSEFEAGFEPTAYPQPGGVLRLLLTNRGRRGQKILLEGGPGQGKSTVTQMLAQVYRAMLLAPRADYRQYVSLIPTPLLPLRIELRLFAEWLTGSKGSVEKYIAELLSKDSGGTSIAVEDIHRFAHDRGMLLIFDGLDEVGSDDLRDIVVQEITDSISRLDEAGDHNIRVIVTSRPPAVAGRLDLLSGFVRLTLRPLSERRVNTYVGKWTDVQCTDAADRERVLSSFQKRRTEKHVSALATNPMQLSVLLHLIRLKGEAFPDKRAELYREYFKTVIDRDVEKSPDLRRNRDDIETLHEVIGFAIHSRAEGDKAGGRLARPALLNLVRGWFSAEGRREGLGETLFKIGEERLGLIVALTGEGVNTEYGFEIQPVREYFAAAFITDKFENAHELFELMIRRSFWKEVARFLAGLRRATERADLLARARSLDSDAENGWRSEGRKLIYQLVQEGVFNSPGHVHRDALSFLLDSLIPPKTSPQVVVEELASDLGALVSACDSDEPRRKLAAIIKSSTSLQDRRSISRLWSVANSVFGPDELIDLQDSHPSDPNLEAMIRLALPPQSGKSVAAELERRGILQSIPIEALAGHWFAAGQVDSQSRNLALTRQHQQRLIEEFAFAALPVNTQPDWCESPYPVWQLGGLLSILSRSIAKRKRGEVNLPATADYSGVSAECAGPLSELISLAKSAALEELPAHRALNRLLQFMADHLSDESIMGLVSAKCAGILLTYAQGAEPFRFEGEVVYSYGSGRKVRTDSKGWRALKSALLPMFEAGIAKTRDRIGRPLTSSLFSGGLYHNLPSHIRHNGEWKSILRLIIQRTKGEKADTPEWIDRVPIHHYWLAGVLKDENAYEILEVLSTHRLVWNGLRIELSSAQVAQFVDAVRRAPSNAIASAGIYALLSSKIWSHVRETLLSKMMAAPPGASTAPENIFGLSQIYGRPPIALTEVARRIVSGKLEVSSPSMATAAANFLDQRSSANLKPLRELAVFPQGPWLIR